MLAADAESDWVWDAKHPTDDTWGLYQQNPRWWGTREQILDPVYATTSFVLGRSGTPGLRKITLTNDPVVDCWRIQKWGAPNPDTDLAGFRAHPSTVNYTRRLDAVAAMMPSEEPRIMAVGGAQTSRGVVWLADLPGSSPADKLRKAWTPGSQDRRVIIADHGTVLDVGADPIPVPAGVCLASPAGPQTEFSDQGRVYLRGATAAFRNVGSGSNYSGTKGWSFVNVGFEGTAGLNLFAPNPMNATGPIMAYASIEGCSFDNFRTLVESPLLGCHWDIRYTNNISGPYAYKVAGSDCQLWTHGGKLDWGQGDTDPRRQALIVLSYLEKGPFGGEPMRLGGLYLTCEGAAGLDIEGNADRDGVDIFGATIEGRNANEPSAGALVRVRGGGVNFFGGNFNYAMSNPGSTGRDDRAFIDCSGGRLGMHLSIFRRGNSTAPFVARRGAGVVDLIGCREKPSNAIVTATNL